MRWLRPLARLIGAISMVGLARLGLGVAMQCFLNHDPEAGSIAARPRPLRDMARALAEQAPE